MKGIVVAQTTTISVNFDIIKRFGAAMNSPLLEMKNITKEFPGVKALDRCQLSSRRG